MNTFLRRFPSFLVVSMGLSLHNAVAVIEGLLGIKTPFIRTPKFNIQRKNERWSSEYFKPSLNIITLLEGILCLYFIFGIATGIVMHDNILMIFHVMLVFGFGIVFFHSINSFRHA
jgi:hypothetical protein